MSLDLAIETYRGLISTPTALRPAALAARRVLPVPKKGSSTHMFRLVKNSTNSLTRVSGKPAGWTSLVLSRGGGLCLNHDFVNLIQSVPERSFNRFVGLRFLRSSSLASKSFIVDLLSEPRFINGFPAAVLFTCGRSDSKPSPAPEVATNNW